jgi:hypothetical protein
MAPETAGQAFEKLRITAARPFVSRNNETPAPFLEGQKTQKKPPKNLRHFSVTSHVSLTVLSLHFLRFFCVFFARAAPVLLL